MQNHILSIVLFTPLVGMFILMLIPKENKAAIKVWANLVMFLGFLVSLPLWWMYDRNNPDFQFVERADWIPSIGARYIVGIDGISLLLILLTTLVGFLSRSEEHTSELQSLAYLVCRLLLEKKKKNNIKTQLIL